MLEREESQERTHLYRNRKPKNVVAVMPLFNAAVLARKPGCSWPLKIAPRPTTVALSVAVLESVRAQN